MLYCCETCDKRYSTEKEALNCERVHAEEKAKRKQLSKVKEDRINEIKEDYKALNEKCEQYFKDYGIYPNLSRSTNINPFSFLFESLF